ncbi:TonB-dependent receptor [Thalassotalea nanhaiensis]|uniref:TonB-dependent receptor n=1 Tax=Thalassotalea nanhaiensis TaxID=3065648 RepID=A0ABY9THK8_9GAMM|nr:TonB-dependent receptor [Colwelliaceae bacterium SQ345]
MKNKLINKRFKKSLLAATLLSALTSANVYADNTTGHISGKTIAQGEVAVAGVEITIINTQTGLSRTINSDENGHYRFPLLPTGTYNIYATKDGYMVAEQENAKVSIGGKTLVNLAMNVEGMETIEVRASSIAPIDTTSSSSGIVVTSLDLERIPVPKSMSAVALLAPGTTKGDSGFGDLVSFGGSSVAENAYYINGLNVTNVRNGLGFSNVPWEMYQSFEVKTGGFSAEFGRAVGVINATTKSGANESEYGISVTHEPDSLREKRPDVMRTEEGQEYYGTEYYRINHARTYETTEVSLWASGSIIDDSLFYYAIYNPRMVTQESASIWNYSERETDDAFWGGKLDWYITNEHIIAITAFSDDRAYEITRSPYDLHNKVKGQYYFDNTSDSIDNGRVVHPTQGSYNNVYETEAGGKNFSIQYTGPITDDLQASIMFGHNEHSSGWSPVSHNGETQIVDTRTGLIISGPAISTIGIQEDKRDQFRADFDYYYLDHTFRFGIDIEKLNAKEDRYFSGNGSYGFTFETDNLMTYFEGGELTYLDSEYAFASTMTNKGSFDTESFALYVQDEWQITDNIVLNLGLRYDEFTNKNGAGEDYIEMDGQIAPRLGFAWDMFGDGESKLSASYGRFYLPVATNTNIRLAGSELNQQLSYNIDVIYNELFNGIDGETLDINNISTFADGTLQDTRQLVDSSIEPMYQEEVMLSFQQTFGDFVWGIRGTYRWLGETIEDVAVDKGFDDYLKEQGIDCTSCTGFNYYVLTNPGSDLTFWADPDDTTDFNGNGENGPLAFQQWTIPSEYLGFPEAERTHLQWDLTVERKWQDDYSISASYTWGHTWGNSEGLVNSDIEQTDSGITQSFDQPGLMDFSNGDLANDRRHTLKVNGAYAITDELTVGFNATWQTGRPNNCLGYHPTDEYASQYGSFSFYCLEEDPESEDAENPDYISVPSPRGSRGRTPNTFIVDMNLRYATDFYGFETVAQLQVYNVFNEITTTQYNETGEIFDGFDGNRRTGKINPDYGLVSSTTIPRYVELSLMAKF